MTPQRGQIAAIRAECDRCQQAVVFGRDGACRAAGDIPYVQAEPAAGDQRAAIRAELQIVWGVRGGQALACPEVRIQQADGACQADCQLVIVNAECHHVAIQRDLAHGPQGVGRPDPQPPVIVAADHLALEQGQRGDVSALRLRLDPVAMPQDEAAIVTAADKITGGQRQNGAHRPAVGVGLAERASRRRIPYPQCRLGNHR